MVIVRFLTVMMKHGYIGEFEIIDDHRAGKIVVNLTGRLNKCGVISPRFDVKLNDLESWTTNLLPSRQFDSWFSQPQVASWTMKRPGGSIWVAKSWDSFSSDCEKTEYNRPCDTQSCLNKSYSDKKKK